MAPLEESVKTAGDFIGPFFDKGSRDPQSLSANAHGLDASQLVEKALLHLQEINFADQQQDPDAPYDGSMVGVLYGLLDLITSYGIVPFLSHGAVFSQRPRSVLIPSIPVQVSQNENLLVKVLCMLMPIAQQQGGTGVHPLLVQRILPDLISATAELAFSPAKAGPRQTEFQKQFESLMVSAHLSQLLPILTSFLQQDAPAWLRKILSQELAMAPLRPQGVRHIIEFLSLSYMSKNSHFPQETARSESQIPISLEAITQASRLITSVPDGMEATEWFTKLAPQLWELVDGAEGIELGRAAGHIIMAGVLNRRATGSPGSIGWELFVVPIMQDIVPARPVNRKITAEAGVLTEDDALAVSLKRLSVLFSSFAHRGLYSRIMRPLFLSLWAIFQHAESRPSIDKTWRELPRSILVRWISVIGDSEMVDQLATSLYWDGEPLWVYGPGSHGGVEIRKRESSFNDEADMSNILTRVGQLDDRVGAFISLLEDAKIDNETAGKIFLRTTTRWLTPEKASSQQRPSLLHEDDSPMVSFEALTNAKMSEVLAIKWKDKFARNPQHILELTSQILHNYVEQGKKKEKEVRNRNKASRAALSNIAQEKPQASGTGSCSDTESDDLASFSISLINTVFTSPDFKRTEAMKAVLSSITESLEYLVRTDFPAAPHIRDASSSLLRIVEPSSTTAENVLRPKQLRQSLNTAIANLTADEPPMRTMAVTEIRKLITNTATFPILDVPSLTHQLLEYSVADAESYVYTAAIPVLVDLAIRAPNPTLRIITDAFTDIEERSLGLKKQQEIQEALDFRLRVGEVLHNFVLSDDFFVHRRFGNTNIETRFSSLRMIIDAVLLIASRRGQRTKTLSRREEMADAERLRQEEAEAAWGGPIPNLFEAEGENADEQAERDALLKVVRGWENTGVEEDVRIRSSGLSVLSVVLEKRLEMLNQAVVDAGLQMVLQILVMETGEAKAILRRAAVLVVMGLLRGMDEALERGEETMAGLGMKQTGEVERVVRWVKDMDGDELVKSHAADVIEGLETWKMKKLYKIRDQQSMLGPSLTLEGNLQGLSVDPTANSKRTAPGKAIVEEIE